MEDNASRFALLISHRTYTFIVFREEICLNAFISWARPPTKRHRRGVSCEGTGKHSMTYRYIRFVSEYMENQRFSEEKI